jgi:hypothetical protein
MHASVLFIIVILEGVGRAANHRRRDGTTRFILRRGQSATDLVLDLVAYLLSDPPPKTPEKK